MFKNNNFYQLLFENHSVPNTYDVLGYMDKKIEKKLIVNNIALKSAQVYSYQLFPAYLNYNIFFSKHFRLKKIKQKLGFAIYLKDYKTISDYLKETCSPQHRKNVTRTINRLESSFNISYKTYFGEMPVDHYIFIMNALKNMIANRFQQREGRNKTLIYWKHHVDQTLDLIKLKRASIFVIYQNDEPIEISINYHVGSIMYSSISSYDLDYGKFSLGNIEIYKQLEWCLLNGIHFFDMGYGDFDYKRRWANEIYEFEDHIFYHKFNIAGPCYALIKECKYKTINYLISKKINDKIYGVFDTIKKKNNSIPILEYNFIPVTSLPSGILKMKNLDLNTNENKFLKKPVYDYLYKYQEHLNDISIYKMTEKSSSYIIQGKNSILELEF